MNTDYAELVARLRNEVPGKLPEYACEEAADAIEALCKSAPTGGTGERSAAIPEGWKLVPIDPTNAMLNASVPAWHTWKAETMAGMFRSLALSCSRT
jgi:hypothetical protein